LAEVVVLTGALWLIPGAWGRIVASAAVGAVLLVVLADYVRLPSRRAVSVERAGPETIGLGDAATLEYHVTSTWRWPLRVVLADDLPAGIDGQVSNETFMFGARESRTIPATVTGQQRGRFPLGDIALGESSAFARAIAWSSSRR
jgi:uncharacterized protein (DUF58 family)